MFYVFRVLRCHVHLYISDIRISYVRSLIVMTEETFESTNIITVIDSGRSRVCKIRQIAEKTSIFENIWKCTLSKTTRSSGPVYGRSASRFYDQTGRRYRIINPWHFYPVGFYSQLSRFPTLATTAGSIRARWQTRREI